MLSTPSTNPFILPSQGVLILGFNNDVDMTSTPDDIWAEGGAIAFPDVADVVDIVSDSADDDAGGTGALTLSLIGVNNEFETIREVVALDGLTPVATLQDFLFVNLAMVATAGSTGINQGKITFTIDGNLCNTIPAEKGQTQSAAAVIPKADAINTEAHLINIFATIGRQPNVLATVQLSRRKPGTNVFIRSFDFPLSANAAPFNLEPKVPVIFQAGEKIVMTVTDVSLNNTLVTGILQFSWLPVPV